MYTVFTVRVKFLSGTACQYVPLLSVGILDKGQPEALWAGKGPKEGRHCSGLLSRESKYIQIIAVLL